MKTLPLLMMLLLALGSCSFTTATGFQECTTQDQCGATGACLSNYCVPMPTGCRRSEGEFDAQNSIPVAALLPIHVTVDGRPDDSEIAGSKALRLGVREANRASGVRGRLFGLFVCDTSSDDATLIKQAQFMITQFRVPALIISGSGATELVANLKERQGAGTMIISPTATSEQLVAAYQVDKSVWRVPPSDGSQAKVMTRLITDRTLDAGVTYDSSSISVLYQEGAYGTAFANALLTELTRANHPPELVSFNDGLSNDGAAAIAVKLAAKSPKTTVFIGLPSDLKSVVTAIVGNQPTLRRSTGHQWLLSDGVKDQAILDGTTRPELVNTIGTTPSQGTGDTYNLFSMRMQQEFNTNPADFSFISHGYDAMYLVMLSAAWATQTSAGVTGASMSDGMTRIQLAGSTPIRLSQDKWPEASNKLSGGMSVNLEGASGNLEFDQTTGAPSSPYDVYQVLDGGFRVNVTLNP